VFKRRADFVMAVDIELDETWLGPKIEELVDRIRESGKETDREEMRLAFTDSVMRHVEERAKSALDQTRQKLKQTESDLEFTTVDVRFSGDREGAEGAFRLWMELTADLMATKRINRAWLRGSDGTNLNYWDEEVREKIDELAESLDDEMKAWIEQEMDDSDVGSVGANTHLTMDQVVHALRESEYEWLSVAELAKQLGVNDNTMRSHLNQHKDVRYEQNGEGGWSLIGEEE
jgi:hypothetical protein